MRVVFIFLLILTLHVSVHGAPLGYEPAPLTIQAEEPISKPLWRRFYPAWRPDSLFAHVRSIVRDPDHRIEPEFEAPDSLVDRVVFWTAVYSQFTSHMRVVHDRKDPGIVYGYIDFSPLYEQMSEVGAGITAAKMERAIQKDIQLALAELGGKRVTSPLSQTDRALLKRFLANHQVEGDKAIRQLVPNVRTQSGQKDIFQAALGRSREYLPNIERVFEEHGLPRSLAKIPFVESSFNVKARSKCGAMGIWQFTPRTARALIHRQDRKLWSDPVSQTRAAAVMLSKNRRALPDWGTTVTSFNSGIGRVFREIRKHDARGIADLTDSRETGGGLGFAGRNYFAEFLAANIVENYQIELLSPPPPPAAYELPQRQMASSGPEPIACYAHTLKSYSAPIVAATFANAPAPAPIAYVMEAGFTVPAAEIWPWLKEKFWQISDAMIVGIGQVTSMN